MITVENVKVHLRIDGDFEDAYIASLIAVAAEYIKKTTGVEHAEGYPATLRHAGLLLIAHWYQNREGVSDKPLTQAPLAVDMLLFINTPGGGLI